jgi:DNA modification methylase
MARAIKAKKNEVVAVKEESPWQDRIVGHDVVPITQLLPHPKNWRQHPKKQNAILKGAIEDIGFIRSVTVNKRTGHLLDGHLRLELAQSAGVEKIRVEYVDLSPEEEAKALLTLDPIAQLATPADEMLMALGADFILQDIESLDLRDFISKMVGDGTLPDKGDEYVPGIDEGAGLQKKYDVKLGQKWLLGDHVIYCGDSTKDIEIALGGRKADLIVTSPPYNLDVAYNKHDDQKKAWEEYKTFLTNVLKPCIANLGEGRALVWNIGVNKSTFHIRQGALIEQDLGLELVREVIWKKVGVPLPKSQPFDKVRGFNPFRVHEVCYVFSKGKLAQGSKIDENHPLYEYDVFELHQSKATEDLPEGQERTGAGKSSSLTKRSKKAHPAAYPVDLPEMFIKHLTEIGEVVLDPFGGAGTTMMACERLGRKCVSVELSPEYVAVAIERWATSTGKTPIIEVKSAKG